MPKVKPDSGPPPTAVEDPWATASNDPPPAAAQHLGFDGGDVRTPDTGADADYGFVPLEDTTEFVNGVWYGPEGTGKTTDVLTMASLGRVLLVNAEGGAKVTALRKRGIDTSNIQVWPDPRKRERASFDGLEALFYQLQAELARDPSTWFGVVMDSGTEVTQLLRENQTDSELASDPKRTDRWQVDRNDWRVMSDQMRVLIRRFRDLPCHFALTCLERQDEVKLDTGEEVQQWGPAVNPGLQSDLLGYVDLVIRCASNELVSDAGSASEFVGKTRKTRQYRAKDRFDATPREMFNPTFLRVLSYVRGELDASSDPEQKAGTAARELAGAYLTAQARAKEEAKTTARAANRTRSTTTKVTAS